VSLGLEGHVRLVVGEKTLGDLPLDQLFEQLLVATVSLLHCPVCETKLRPRPAPCKTTQLNKKRSTLNAL
jgi:hypothetical protein